LEGKFRADRGVSGEFPYIYGKKNLKNKKKNPLYGAKPSYVNLKNSKGLRFQ